MTIIAEAFVAVRPDLSKFERELRTQAQAAIRNAQTTLPTIKVKAELNQRSLDSVVRQINRTRATINVTPLLDARAQASLNRQLRQLELGASARITATGGAQAGGAPTAAASSEAQARGLNKAAQAAAELSKEEQTLVDLERTAAIAAAAARRETFQLEVARESAADATAALSDVEKKLQAARRIGDTDATRRLRSLRDELRSEKELAEARVAAIEARRLEGGPIALTGQQSKGLTESAAQAEAKLRGAIVARDAAQQALDKATATTNERLIEYSRRTLESREATVRAAEAEKERVLSSEQESVLAAEAAKAAEVEADAAVRLSVAQKDLIAVQEDAAAATAAAARVDLNAAEVKRELERATEGVKAARALENAPSGVDVEAQVALKELTTAEGTLKLNLALAQSEQKLSDQRAAAAQKAGQEAKATAELRAVRANLLSLEEQQRVAIAAGNQTVAERIRLLIAQREALESQLATRANVAGLLDQQVALEAAVARARAVPAAATQLESAQQHLAIAAAAKAQALQLQRLADANVHLTAVERLQIQASIDQALALEASTKATYEAARGARIHGTQLGQARRGILATVASFLGLRGAVLASSLPFLIATVGVTALAKSIGQAGELQRSLREFQAVSGATADDVERVRAAVRALGADLTLPQVSANDAAKAMTELSKAGLGVQDAIAGTRGTLQLAIAANLDVGKAAEIAASQLNAFGLAGDQAERVTNLLAGASIAAQGEIGDFAIGFQQVAAVAAQAGLSIEQTTALLTQMARAGIQGSDAGTSLRVAITRLIPTTARAQEAFKQLGVNIDESRKIGEQLPSIVDQFSAALQRLSPGEQTRLIRDIFGQDAQRAAIITLTGFSDALLRTQAEISKTGNAASLTEAKSQGLAGAVDGLGSTTADVATAFGQIFIPALTAAAKGMTDIVSTAGDLVDILAPLIKILSTPFSFIGGDVIAKFLALTAAAVGLNRLVGRFRDHLRKSAEASKELQESSAAAAATAEKAAVERVASEARVTEAIEKTNVAYGKQLVLFGTQIPAAEQIATAATITAEREKQIAIAETNAVIEGQMVLFGRLASEQAASIATTSRLSRALGRIKASLGGASLAGLTGGIAATFLGDRIGGRTGGLLSGAGEGAIIGSFFPGPGTLVGGAAGFGLAAITEAKQKTEENRLKVQERWDALSFQEQVTIAQNPGGPEYIQFFNLKVKDAPPAGSQIRGRSIPGRTPTSVPQNLLERFGLQLQNPFQGTFAFPGVPGQLPRTPGAGVTQTFQRLFGLGLPIGQLAAEQAKKAQEDKAGIQKLEIARAEALGLDQELRAILERQRDALLKRIANLSDFSKSVGRSAEDQKKVRDALTKAFEDLKDINTQIANIIKDGFDPRRARIDLAAVRAQGTETLADDLQVAKDILADESRRYQELVDSANATKQELADQRIKIAQAQNDVTSTQRQIAEDQQRVIDDQIAAQGIALARAAQAAGNFGPAQAAYIAFLRQQVAAAKQGTSEYENAVSQLEGALQQQRDANLQLLQARAEEAGNQGRAEKDLIAALRRRVRESRGNALQFEQAQAELRKEQQRFAQARLRSIQLGFNVQQARIDTQRAAADLTETNADDIRVERLALRLIDRQLRQAYRQKTAAKKGTDAYKEAVIEIQNLVQQRLGVLKAIKDLQDQDKQAGLTPDLLGLFSEANRIFAEFAPNIQFPGMEGVLGDIGGTATTPLTRREERLASALDENTAALKDVKDGIGTTVNVEQNLPVATTVQDQTARGAQYARFAVRAYFDG